MRRCCIKGCNSNSYKNEEGLSFFRFPLNECLKKLWIEKIGNENIKPAIGIAICSKHFEDHCVNRTMNCVRLKDGAIPTLFSAVKSDKQCIGPETGGKGGGELSSIVPLNKKFYDTAKVRPVRSNHMQETDCDKYTNQLKPNAVSGFNEESSSDEASDSLHKEYIKEQRAVPLVRLTPLSKEMLMKYSRNFEEATDTNQNKHDVDKSQVCKLCLRVDAKMYDLNDETLNMLYQYIIGIVPRTDSKDRFPMNICWECKARLHSASVLKYKALTSDQLMREYLDSHETLNITEISNLHREHNLESSLIVDSIETFNCATETHSYTESDTLVNTGTAGSTFEEDLDDNSQIDEIDVENQSIEDDTKSEIDIIPNNSQDSFQSEAPKVNWDNIILVKAPTVVDNQFNVPVFDNISKMADESETNDYSFDMNMDDDNEEIVAKEPSKLRMRKIKTSKNRTRPQQKPDENLTTPIDETVFTVKSLTQERQIEEVMARKNSARYLKAPYKCTVCYEVFTRQDILDRHSMRHSEKAGPLKCAICKVRMKWSWQMRAHMQRLHISEFKCKLCPLVTRSRHVALTHTKFHEVQKFICSHCGMHFENEPTMLSHLRLKHMSDCVCELCGYTFVGDNGVRAHKRLRHKFDDKNQPFEGPHCKVCDIKFLSQEAYDKHLQLSSKHLKSDGYPNRSADSNQRRKYKNDDEGFHIMTCEECGVKAAGVRGYTRHFRDAHPGLLPAQCDAHDAPYLCEHCGKMFTTVYLLKGHMWVHTGKKLFQCDICNKSFTAKLTLKEHIMRHESKHQNHECLLCGKQFVNKSNILRHFRVAHEGVRRFKCHVCHKSFASKVEMTAHVNHVHLNIPRPKRIRRRPKK